MAAPEAIRAIHEAWSIAVRAGSRPHRFTRVWAVVVESRVFARSWSLAPRSWYRTLLLEPSGVVRVGGNELPFRAARARGEALKAAVDRAYLRKYAGPGEVRYARDLCRPRSRATTTELILEAEAPPARRVRGRGAKKAASRARRPQAGSEGTVPAPGGPPYRAPRAFAARA